MLRRFPAKLGALENIPLATLERLIAGSTRANVNRGVTVLTRGERTDSVYLSYSGHLRVMLTAPSGRETIVREIYGGDMFGEVEAIDGGPRTTTIVAVTDSALAVVPAAHFRTAVSETSEGALWFAGMLTRKLRPMVERTYELAMLGVNARVHCELLRMCIEAVTVDNVATIDRPPTHETIAARIGAAREAVTRELSFLASIGLITRSARRLVVHDVAKLATIVAARTGTSDATTPL